MREKPVSPTAATHGTTGSAIADALRTAILAGEYEPGERVRQSELAARHGASRLPVREALRMLESEGLLTLVANTGAWVAQLSVDECEEMYQMREHLEPLLLGMNVPFLTEDDVDELEKLAEAMELTNDVEEFLKLDREFHLSCLEAVTTSVLGDTVLALWNRTQHYRRAATRLFYAEGDRSVHHDHYLIVGALRRRDVDEAERVLAGHIRRSRLELVRNPSVFAEG